LMTQEYKVTSVFKVQAPIVNYQLSIIN